MAEKRKICFVITSKIHYGRSKKILRAIQDDPNLELQIIVGASAILSNYGDVLDSLERDGFPCHAKITMTLEGGSPVAMAKTTGIGITEFATAFDNLQPDVVVVRGDRYEVLSAAVAAAYLNITVAHIEGGDITGTIDESVRHAITKMSHVHFATNSDSHDRIVRMGERPEYVFNVGCPGLEFIAEHDHVVSPDLINYLGVGEAINLDEPYLMVMQHPVTTEVGQNRQHVEETLHAIHELGMPTIWFWPNVDAGTDEVSKAIRVFREKENPNHIRFLKYLPAEDFIGLLKGTACLIGNSSAGIKETSYLGVPVVNVGTRQQGRMRAPNVIDTDYSRQEIISAVRKQMENGPYETSTIYYKPGTSKNITDHLRDIPLYTQKRFYE